MDMGHDSSASNTTNLPLSDPRCNSDSCLAFKKAHQASQAQISWASQFLYGHYTTWYYLVAISLAMLVYIFHALENQRAFPPSSTGKTSISNKTIAFLRWISYRRIHGRFADSFSLPAMGMLLFTLFTCLYLFLLTFIQRPYYRGHRGYGSPPLAVRTGLMATALTPIIVALSGKVNFVTMLTGIGHEKLNALHRYTSYMCLFLSIVHTVPFIVAPLKDGGAKQLRKQYYKPGAYEYTGTPPLGILVGLCVLSIPWIRTRFYTLFYRLHIPLWVVYLGTMFWHCNQSLDSWAYLWASLAIYLASIVGRAFWKWQTFNVRRSWFQGFPAEFTVLEGGMTRVDVFTPTDFTWKAGQHCWLRFPHLSVLHNHPFTISSLCKPSSTVEKSQECHVLRFYVRSYRGLTKALFESADKLNIAHVDGPYGGLTVNAPKRYDQLILVAGGGGVSACIPMMMEAASQMAKGGVYVQKIHLVWMVREAKQLGWIIEELKEILRIAGSARVSFQFFVTEQTSPNSPQLDTGSSKNMEVTSSTAPMLPDGASNLHYERPFLLDLIPKLLSGRRILLFGCGPESLKIDLSNAAYKAQSRVFKGEADEVALHTETFGW